MIVSPRGRCRIRERFPLDELRHPMMLLSDPRDEGHDAEVIVREAVDLYGCCSRSLRSTAMFWTLFPFIIENLAPRRLRHIAAPITGNPLRPIISVARGGAAGRLPKLWCSAQWEQCLRNPKGIRSAEIPAHGCTVQKPLIFYNCELAGDANPTPRRPARSSVTLTRAVVRGR